MDLSRLKSIALLVILYLMASSVNAQDLGIYSTWSIDPDTGEVYMFATTYLGYSTAYYYDTFVSGELGVWPAVGDAYTTAWMEAWGTDCDATIEGTTTIDQQADLSFNTTHQVTITYQVVNLVQSCYTDGTCALWFDDDRISELDLLDGEYDDNISWFAPGEPPLYRDESGVENGYIDRPGSFIPRPLGENSTWTGTWINGDLEGGIFDMQLIPLFQGQKFNGRTIAERFDASQHVDGCYNQVPTGPQLPVPNPGPDWQVDDENKYYGDADAVIKTWISYYQPRISSSCITTEWQNMYINYGSMPAPGAWYEGHYIGIQVFPYNPGGCSQVYAFRGGASGYAIGHRCPE